MTAQADHLERAITAIHQADTAENRAERLIELARLCINDGGQTPEWLVEMLLADLCAAFLPAERRMPLFRALCDAVSTYDYGDRVEAAHERSADPEGDRVWSEEDVDDEWRSDMELAARDLAVYKPAAVAS